MNTLQTIVSPQDLAKRFEEVREELMLRVTNSEAANAMAGTRAISAMRREMNERVANLESLSIGTLLRLIVRKVTGK